MKKKKINFISDNFKPESEVANQKHATKMKTNNMRVTDLYANHSSCRHTPIKQKCKIRQINKYKTLGNTVPDKLLHPYSEI